MLKLHSRLGACALGIVLIQIAACGSAIESTTRETLSQAESTLELDRDAASPTFDGSLASFEAAAVRQSPAVRAAFERWRAATLRIASARRLPEPMLTYQYFIRHVETRVGPQRHRLSLSQSFPWPTQLSRGAEAMALSARSQEREFDALQLEVRARVADAYWRLWFVQETHRLKSEHDLVLETLVGVVRGRVEVNQASLADLNQVELMVAQHHDHLAEHEEEARAIVAELFAVLGMVPPRAMLTTTTEPSVGLPAGTLLELQQAAVDHPRVQVHGVRAQASHARAEQEGARRLPGFRLGVDYIETGPARNAGVDGSGDDALMVSLGLTLPIWFGSYDDAVDAETASARAHLWDQDEDAAQARSDVSRALSQLRNTERRVRLFRETLIPQAETTFLSVLGSYQVGRSSVSDTLMAQDQLLSLLVEYARVRSDHARAWSRLSFLTGVELETVPTEDVSPSTPSALSTTRPEQVSPEEVSPEAASPEAASQAEGSEPTATEREATEPPRPRPAVFSCPMHPQIREPRAGSCPICGMDLVRTRGGAR